MENKNILSSDKERINIWLIGEGEPLPVDGRERLMRLGMLAKYLSGQGHKVTWWSSTFIHGEKRYYCKSYKEIRINPKERLVLLHSPVAYKKNISLSRIVYHQKLATAFRKYSKRKTVPDLIFCAWPTSQFAREAVRYGKKNKVPVIIDIRDLWPDIFNRAFPDSLQWLAKIGLKPLQYAAAVTLRQATGITGMVPYATSWGCRYAGRAVGKQDATIYIGNERPGLSKEEQEKNQSWWQDRGVSEETWNICYFGTLSISVDLKTVIDAVKILSQRYKDIRLVIGGEGDCKEELVQQAQGSKHIIFAGWLNGQQMNSLMGICRCGTYSYKNSEDFYNTFSNKGIQYLSGKLPILNSLGGFARTMLEENECGLTYKEGDIQDCARQIERLYTDSALCKRMAENAYELFEKKFESNVVNRQFEQYFYQILGGLE
ncbi:MAG: glycosyltransferase family 4 protein [Lachnospiraceae bacterium]|nr:glycosyltransferase family 4 protein [Lachnospiraceae bacterium]